MGNQQDSSISPEFTDNLGEEINSIHQLATEALVRNSINPEDIQNGNIRIPSILYMIYWFHRLRNNNEEQNRVRENLVKYIGKSAPDSDLAVNSLLNENRLSESSIRYSENLLVPTKTVDLVITKPDDRENKDKDILCVERSYYPFGLALPGGIIRDIDEDNPLGLPPQVFAALRIAGEKVLRLGNEALYREETDCHGKKCYVVKGKEEFPCVRIYSEDEGGYHYSENIKSVLSPSDPRHIVDTTAFRCELEGEIPHHLIWRNTKDIMSPSERSGGFAFGHHREIVAQISSETSLERERTMKEAEFIRSIIRNPLVAYQELKARFDKVGNSPEASFPELFPAVDRMLNEMFKDEINQLCQENPIFAGIRDKAVISLRQVCLKRRTFCPYLPTLLAISQGIAFFDYVSREKRGFYLTMPKDKIVEHNPRTTANASYHMYRYKYRFDELLSMLPEEIIIPTYEALSATDLMRIRGVPIRFVGISDEFLYVDEFDQSPEEFFIHDCNHSWRMIKEDQKAEEIYGKTKDQLIQESNTFIKEYLEHIKIKSTDTEEEREMKKLKKIILFEIVHEDARPFLKQVVCKYIQQKEGKPVPFEVPRIDKATGYMDVIDTLDTGISTLSYVRNKLQHGFYDHIDAQLPQIVDPKYRTAAWITRSAYEMLVELDAKPEQDAELDELGHVSYKWLMQRTCAVGPDNIHEVEDEDPDVIEYGDGAQRLNPKRYQVGTQDS